MAATNPEIPQVPSGGFSLGIQVDEIAPDLMPEGVSARAIACTECDEHGNKTCIFIICNIVDGKKLCWIVTGRNTCRTPIRTMYG
jgi:hypothetical protein